MRTPSKQVFLLLELAAVGIVALLFSTLLDINITLLLIVFWFGWAAVRRRAWKA